MAGHRPGQTMTWDELFERATVFDVDLETVLETAAVEVRDDETG